MRKLPLIATTASVLLLLAACGDDGGTADTSAAPSATTAPGDTTATSSTVPATTAAPRPTLPKPAVPVPAAQPTELVITDLKEGTGPAAVDGDTVVVHYVGVRSADGVEFDNSYDRGTAFQVNLGAGGVIDGWDQGLVGAKTGGQRRLDIPAALGYGDAGSGDDIPPGTNLSFIIDVLAVIPPVVAADEPTLVIAPSVQVPEVVPVDLIVGTGPEAVDGSTATFSYIFYRADTGEKLYTSWDKEPATIPLVPNGTIDGLIEGVVGMKTGGRRQLTIPYSMIFGGDGEDSILLDPNIDVVAVVDLLATYG